MLSESIAKLVQYGITTGLTPECERNYTTNLLLDVFHEDDYEKPDNIEEPVNLEATLGELLDEAVKRGLIEDSIVYRDLFDTRLMNCLMPRPGQVQKEFWDKYKESPKEATDYFYKLSQDSNYIRRYRVEKDQKWKVDSPYGEIDITINLSKPEKDPKAIANDTPWGFQYSPYVYYNEHCIVFNGQHTPMKIERNAFIKLFDFVKLFPHYFLGSNADLPIVGGSILSHDHFQGGHYTFAMAKAPIEQHVVLPGFEDVEAGIVKWPLSVLRIRHKDSNRLVDLATHVLEVWRGYADEAAFIYAETNGEPHNTITPIARKVGELHHIKKENIGLIEVMGLAVLPARLKGEMELLEEYILEGKDISSNEQIEKHAEWVKKFLPKYPEITKENIHGILQKEIGIVFTHVLEDAGVYKCTTEGREAFMRFLETL